MNFIEVLAKLNEVMALRRKGQDAAARRLFNSLKPEDLPAFSISSGRGFKFDPAKFTECVKAEWSELKKGEPNPVETYIRKVTTNFRIRKHNANRGTSFYPPCLKEPEYRAWRLMKRRCYGVNYKSYKDYGGRGIRVFEGWLHDYPSFLAHIGRKPSANHSLDRIDSDGHYEPGNVRWATHVVQKNNRSGVIQITSAGKTQSLAAWAREIGITKYKLRRRLEVLDADQALDLNIQIPKWISKDEPRRQLIATKRAT